MASNKFQKLVQRPGLLHFIPTVSNKTEHQAVQKSDRRILYLKPSHALVTHEHEVIKEFVSRSASSFTLDGNTVEFYIQPSGMDIVKRVYLAFTNTIGTANASVKSSYSMIDHIEFYADGGSTLAQTIYGNNLYQWYIHKHTNEQLTNLASITQTSATLSSMTTLSSGTAYTTYLEIDCFLNQHVYLPFFKHDLLVRVVFRPKNQFDAGAGTAVFNISNCRFILVGEDLPPGEKVELSASLAKKGSISYKFQSVYRQNETRALAASTLYDIVLGVQGQVPLIFFNLKPTTNTYDVTAVATNGIQSFEFVNSTGKSMHGDSIIYTDFMTRVQQAEKFPMSVAASGEPGIYHYSFTSHPSELWANGQILGYQIFDGHDRLRFTTTSGLSSATYLLEIYAYKTSYIHIYADGRVEAIDS